MKLFCWHRWETPAYNAALNLREGLMRCGKCGSVKGYKRLVRDPESEEERQALQEMQGDGRQPMSLANLAGSAVASCFAIGIMGTALPHILESFNDIAKDVPSDAGPSGNAVATLVLLIPLVFGCAMAVWVVVYLIRVVKGDDGGGEDASDNAPPIDPGTGRRSVRPKAIAKRLRK